MIRNDIKFVGVEEREVQVILDFCEKLICDQEISVADHGYTIIAALADFPFEFTELARVTFYTKLLARYQQLLVEYQQDAQLLYEELPWHYQFHRSYLFSHLTAGGRTLVEGFVNLNPDLIPCLYSEAMRIHAAQARNTDQALVCELATTDPLLSISGLIRCHSTLIPEESVRSLIEQMFQERQNTLLEHYPKVFGIISDLVARKGEGIPKDSVSVLAKIISFFVGISWVRSVERNDPRSSLESTLGIGEEAWSTVEKILGTHMREPFMDGLLELLHQHTDYSYGAVILVHRSLTDKGTRLSINVDMGRILEILVQDTLSNDPVTHSCLRLSLIQALLSDEAIQSACAAEPDWTVLSQAIVNSASAVVDGGGIDSADSQLNCPRTRVPLDQSEVPDSDGICRDDVKSQLTRMISTILSLLQDLPFKVAPKSSSTVVAEQAEIPKGKNENALPAAATEHGDSHKAKEELPELMLTQARRLRRIALSTTDFLNDKLKEKLISAYQPSAYRIAVGNWLDEIKELADYFVRRESAPLELRQQTLGVVNEALQKAQELGESEAVLACATIIVEALEVEKEHTFRNNLVYCIISFISEHLISINDDESFERVVRVLWKSARNETYLAEEDNERLPTMLPDAGLVVLLMRSSLDNPQRARMIYHNILNLIIWRDTHRDVEATVMLMRGLFRIRSDIDHRIFFVALPEGERLATILDRNAKEPKFDRRSSVAPLVQPPSPAWMYGEVSALPDEPDANISSVLRSDPSTRAAEDDTDQGHASGMEDVQDDYGDSDDKDDADPTELTESQFQETIEVTEDVQEYEQSGNYWPPEKFEGEPDSDNFAEDDLRGHGNIPEIDNFQSIEAKQYDHLDMRKWLQTVINIIENGERWDWEIYSYVIVHLPAQLSNQSLFTECIAEIRWLAMTICSKIQKETCMKPPDSSNLKQADVVLCLIESLTTIIGYHWKMERSETMNMISTFIFGLTHWNTTVVPCIHALTLCCYELPISLQRDLVRIVDTMKNIVTKSDAAIHVLEFLAGLSRLDLASRFHGNEIRVVFGVCTSYIDYARGKKYDEAQQRAGGRSTNPTRQGSIASGQRPSTEDIPQYVFAISYHVITFWFLTLKAEDQKGCLAYLEPRLLSKDLAGNVEDEGLVTLDHLWRVVEGRSMDSPAASSITPDDPSTKSWVSEYCILTVSYKEGDAYAEVVERRCSGTDFRQLPVAAGTATTPDDIFTGHGLSTAMNGPFSSASPPTPLNMVDATKRALSFFDRTSPVDYLKCGVIYVGEAQTEEKEILANVSGSQDYNLLVSRLGDRITLPGHRGNVAGLDTGEFAIDGLATHQHSDGVTTLNYHITTMMPTDRKNDPGVTRKKSHIGNDFVNIVFNNSGLVSGFDFHTFPSAFNYVYIVVTPEARQTFIQTRTRSRDDPNWFEKSWFRVQVMTREDFPDISSAAETKVVSGAALAAYVRNLALNAEVFCRVWQNRGSGEYPSSWRSRLNQIRQLCGRAEKMERERLEKG